MKLGKILRKTGHLVKKSAEKAAKQIKWSRKINEAKREILSRFTLRQLEQAAIAKGIPLYYVDPFTGRKIKLRTKIQAVNHLAENLTLDEVVALARKYKIRHRDVIQDLENYRKQLFQEDDSTEETYTNQSQSENSPTDIIELLREFRPETVTSEEDLEKQLYQFLRAKLGDRVARQYQLDKAGNQRIDIAIDGKIGIEIKIAESSSRLQRLVGQVLDYRDYLDQVIALIYDTGAKVDLDRYTEKLSKLGADVVIIQGPLKKHRKEIIIKGAKKIILS